MIERIERIAPEGKLWVCLACGKTSRDLRGDRGTGWDEACVINAALVEVERLVYGGVNGPGRVCEIKTELGGD